jgi:hypothetical protein
VPAGRITVERGVPWTTAKAAAPVLGRVLAQGGQSVDTIWFGPDRLASVAERSCHSGLSSRTQLSAHANDAVVGEWLT